MRMVMDADGKVHDAEGYSGDVEAGVERFERKFGSQTNERTVERNMRNAVPDYARYTPPGDEQQEISGAGRGHRNGQEGEPNLDWAYEDTHGVTRWSDENSNLRWPRPRKQKRTTPALRGRSEAAERSRDKRRHTDGRRDANRYRDKGTGKYSKRNRRGRRGVGL